MCQAWSSERSDGGGGTVSEVLLATEGALPDDTPRRDREHWERDHVEASALGVGELGMSFPSSTAGARGVSDSELVLASSTTRSPGGDTDTESGWEEACSQLICSVQERATNHVGTHAGSALGGSFLPASNEPTPVNARHTVSKVLQAVMIRVSVLET